MQTEASYSFIKMHQILAWFQISESTVRRKTSDGLFPPPVSLGARSIAWILHEVEEIAVCIVRGDNEIQIRETVARQVADRPSLNN
jgi:prophage regulatory protein